MPAGSVVAGRQWQMTNTDHFTAYLNRKFPLTWSEFIERSGDSNQLPHSDLHFNVLGNVIWVELLEVGDRLKGCVVVVETENLVVRMAVEGASVSTELAQPHTVSKSAPIQHNEVLLSVVGAVVLGKNR